MRGYSTDFKLKFIKDLKASTMGKAAIIKKYGIYEQTATKWEKLYDLYGEAGLTRKSENSTYPGTFKQAIVEDMRNNGLSQQEISLKYNVGRKQIQDWERIYLEDGPKGLYVDRRGRKGRGRPPKKLDKKVEEDLIAENQRLRMENAYLKKLNALVREKERSK